MKIKTKLFNNIICYGEINYKLEIKFNQELLDLIIETLKKSQTMKQNISININLISCNIAIPNANFTDKKDAFYFKDIKDFDFNESSIILDTNYKCILSVPNKYAGPNMDILLDTWNTF